MNQTSREGQGKMRMQEGSAGCAGSGEQPIQPKRRLRSVPSMSPVALRSGSKEMQSHSGEMQLPCERLFLPWMGVADCGAAAGKGRGVCWLKEPARN